MLLVLWWSYGGLCPAAYPLAIAEPSQKLPVPMSSFPFERAWIGVAHTPPHARVCVCVRVRVRASTQALTRTHALTHSRARTRARSETNTDTDTNTCRHWGPTCCVQLPVFDCLQATFELNSEHFGRN